MIDVFIDGSEGTTGLEIESRLAGHAGVKLLEIDPELRKDPAERKRLLVSADVAFLCLPDAAAIEACALVDGSETVIIDASTAHRTNPAWAYGFPELSPHHAKAVASSNRISVPGCHATGFNALIYPLVQRGAVKKSDVLACYSLTGYSGGGKKLIAEYEENLERQRANSLRPTALTMLNDNPERRVNPALMGARPYALGLRHKHLPEMQAVCGLDNPPIFQPNLAPIRKGMLVSVPLAANALEIYDIYKDYYRPGGCVKVMEFGGEDTLKGGCLDMEGCNGTNNLEIFVFGHEKQTLLMARLDNLGKGASGAAVQCMELRMGMEKQVL